MKVEWSNDAQKDYFQNIDYLLSQWSGKSASNFIEEVDAILELIKQHPKIFPLCGYKSIRRAVIRKEITLFYKIEKDIVYLVRFWNTYQDPGSITL